MIVIVILIAIILIALPSTFLLVITKTDLLEPSMMSLYNTHPDALVIVSLIAAALFTTWILSVVIRVEMARNARAHGATDKDIADSYGKNYIRFK